jgi:hypothetical protein
MKNLTKDQKDEYAVSFAILALYDGSAETTSEQINILLEATGNTEVAAYYPIIFANLLNSPEKIAEMISSPSAGGGGGGGGAYFHLCVVFSVVRRSLISFLSHFPFQAAAVVMPAVLKLKWWKKKRKKKKKLKLAEVWICLEVMVMEVTIKLSLKSNKFLRLRPKNAVGGCNVAKGSGLGVL